MASVVPVRFVANVAGDAGRVAVGAVIDKPSELSDHVERANFLYAVAGRRSLAARVFNPAATTTSATFVYYPDWLSRIATDRHEVGITTWASDAIVEVSVLNAATGAVIGSATTLTHSAGAASVSSTTLSLPIVSVVEQVLIRIGLKRNTTQASLYSIKVLELSLVAATLPS